MNEALAPPKRETLATAQGSRCSARFLNKITRDFARSHLLLSQGSDEHDAEAIFASPETPAAVVHNVGVALKAAVSRIDADPESLARAIDAAYGAAKEKEGDLTIPEIAPSELEELLESSERDLLATQGKAPLIRLVDAILFDALSHGASDVHLQPLQDRLLVRLRIDGVLHTVRELPAALSAAVVSRCKVLGRMDVAEHRLPQDGRATISIGERSVDLRIATLPSHHGERTVIRFLEGGGVLRTLETLGMPSAMRAAFLASCSRPDGIVLVCGPTGSGKTTTLYATLQAIATPTLNIMTIEDPIEYELSSAGMIVSQSQVAQKKGITFASGLRHLLRQDPDVILVGEIRDSETARMAAQSSLTGHLVLSTLHTNDAVTAITRLLDLDVEPFLLAASLRGALAQRLARRAHAACSGSGCTACLGSGYLGRVGIYEWMPIDEELRRCISRGVSIGALRDAARAAGWRSLAEHGAELVASGVTDRVELSRVLEASS